MSAQRCVYRGYLPNTATALYTFAGISLGNSKCRVKRIRLHNTHSAALLCHVAVVPTGGTLTDAKYKELEYSLASKATLIGASKTGDMGDLILDSGEMLVMWAGTADLVTARVDVVDVV